MQTNVQVWLAKVAVILDTDVFDSCRGRLDGQDLFHEFGKVFAVDHIIGGKIHVF